MFRAFLQTLRLEEDALTQAILRARARAFLVEAVEKQRSTVSVAAQRVVTGPSSKNGLFDATTWVSAEEILRQ